MRFLLLCLALWLLVSPAAALAQSFPPDLIVWLRDSTDAGVAGVTVIVRDQSGTHELRRATTNTEGRAELAGIEDPAVRVVVQGQADGVTLYQPGEDAQGIRLAFATRPAQLDLRVEVDGMVIPDPATMIDPDPSLAGAELERVDVAATIQALPVAPAVPTAVLPATTDQPAVVAGAGTPAMADPTWESTTAESPAWLGWLLVVVFVGMCGVGAFAYQRWGRA